MFFNAIVLAALASSTLATPISNKRVVHEKREVEGFLRGARVERDAIIPVRIALKQSNLEHGYDAVMDVSDPDSANYGKHWTLEKVREFFAPPEGARETVRAWLLDSGIHHSMIGDSEDGAWIGINVPASQAEDLLSAQYHEHVSADETIRLGCDEYSLPAHISDLVDYIKPGISLSPPIVKRGLTPRTAAPISIENAVQFSGAPKKAPFAGVPASAPGDTALPADLRHCGTNITTQCIRALYDIPENNANIAANNFGIAEFSPTAYSQLDLNEYYAVFNPDIPAGTHPILYSIDGGKAPVSQARAGAEADLDFEIAIPLVYPQATTLYQVGAVNFNKFTDQQAEAELTFILPLLDGIDGSFCTAADKKNGLQCGGAPVPRVLSISYGSPEIYNFQAAVIRSCNEIMKLSLQGSTFVVSSGDWGVANAPGPKTNGCVNPANYNPAKAGGVFSPSFPQDCTYVLSVGATQLLGNQNVNDPESVMDIPEITEGGATFGSGGGFSNYFSRPSYQAQAVNTYLNNYVPDYKYYTYNGNDIFSGKSNIGANGGVYNRAGRGFPDVSANGVNFTAVTNGEIANYVGTSISAPIWGSIITLLNEARTKKGQPPVGFVQPVLYKNPQAFHDIVHGTNPGCDTDGFPAVKGWDPSSGLGTPDFPALLKVFTGKVWNGHGGGWDEPSP